MSGDLGQVQRAHRITRDIVLRMGVKTVLPVLVLALFTSACERTGDRVSGHVVATESCAEQEPETTTNDELLVMLETEAAGPWREAVIRLAHRIDDVGDALDDRVGRSPQLDKRIEAVLAIALLYSLPVDELERYPKLDSLAQPQIKRARELLRANPPMAPNLRRVFRFHDSAEPVSPPVIDPRLTVEMLGGFIVPYLLEETRSEDPQTRAAALNGLRQAVAARPLVAHLLHDHSKVREFHGDYYSSSTIAVYAFNVGKNRWNEKLTLEVEDYVDVLLGLSEPYDPFHTLVNSLREENTFTAATWDEWWARARPLWNEWWDAKESGRAKSRDDLLNISRKRRALR
jgi:hypothetical protein